ncbi:ABC transporter ATP-binding protein [Heyndrickxia camelliae]|uniref:ABC transporter ATP-binding protein n=1 Tax=Heyndrickxia camelliae TaxID=1707093 RepID=A0A2N3LHS7_9BACI|nr:ABC transporter ATP-binding protein [Heyndrickxia camelliae]PKR84124.1 ABC transporter ATP-binding protein [Heyndrickxia camelliae]
MGIQISHLTKVFPNDKGIFDLSFEVNQGEVFGYLGPNGAGKSTTIRHLMGYMKPRTGFAKINGLDCWSNSPEIQKVVGYLPGEIAFFDNMNGLQFLELLGGMRGMKNKKKRDELIERFQFNVKTPIRKMSKGMKQKVGIVAAFMHDPEILILDEPTSGLDPLMQSMFIDLILEEKSEGKTILMSSHIFQEIDRTCDRVGIIRDGRLVAIENVQHLQSIQRKVFDISVRNQEDLEKIKQSGLRILSENELRVKVAVQGEYNHFVKVLAECQINNLDIHAQSLEEIFMHFYEREEKAR